MVCILVLALVARVLSVADTTTALEALEKGFNDLMDLCDVVTEKFTTARDQFNEESGNRMEV
jgi:DNA-directed RNA polymerase I and III subunit RPAC2